MVPLSPAPLKMGVARWQRQLVWLLNEGGGVFCRGRDRDIGHGIGNDDGVQGGNGQHHHLKRPRKWGWQDNGASRAVIE